MSDGFVKNSNSYFSFGLRCIHRNSMVRKVQIITQDLRALPILIILVIFFFAIGMRVFKCLIR